MKATGPESSSLIFSLNFLSIQFLNTFFVSDSISWSKTPMGIREYLSLDFTYLYVVSERAEPLDMQDEVEMTKKKGFHAYQPDSSFLSQLWAMKPQIFFI